jgi:uncharacterized protein YegL
MGKLMGKADTAVLTTASNFSFSAQRPDTLGATEYTLVTAVIDTSGSTSGFNADLVKAYQQVIQSCRLDPRAENLLVRSVQFNSGLTEIHGFTTLDNIDEQKIAFVSQGNTALYDAVLESIEALGVYANTLIKLDYLVNGIVFIVTDGEENVSRIGNPAKIADLVAKLRKSEDLDSVKVILVGMGDPYVEQFLKAFHQDAKLDQFIHVGKATPQILAKLGGFISRSISSSSQSLGSGGPSQNLTI